MPEIVAEPVFVPWSPAAIPATCVAWNDCVGSNGSFAYFHTGDGGANARWTITFGVARLVLPFGKPGGYVSPVALKYGCDASTPSSMIPILIPCPAVARPGPQSLSAPISSGERTTFSESEW